VALGLDVADDDRRNQRRRSSDQPSPVKNIGISVTVISLVGSIFAAGYNWRSVDILERTQDQFVRKDVQGQQIQNVNDRLNDVSRQLEEIRQELRQRRP
jgi:hypothetical protein